MDASSVAISSGRLRSAVGAGIFYKICSKCGSSLFLCRRENKECESLEYIKSVIAKFFFFIRRREKKSGVSIKTDANRPNRPRPSGHDFMEICSNIKANKPLAIALACRIPRLV